MGAGSGLGIDVSVMPLGYKNSQKIMDSTRWCPDKCPITRRDFFMWIEHPKKGMVPTYGGPFDSYTIPEMDDSPDLPYHERELLCAHYDHDAGYWKEDEILPLRVCHEKYINFNEDKKS